MCPCFIVLSRFNGPILKVVMRVLEVGGRPGPHLLEEQQFFLCNFINIKIKIYIIKIKSI